MRVEHEQGYTLIEMLLVVGLLAIIAAIAVPSFRDNNDRSLDRTARELARAVRFAHSEALRTGQDMGINISTAGQSLRVYRLSESGLPVYDIYDPLTKQIYILRFGSGSLVASIDQVYFKFAEYPPPQTYMGFAGNTGVPKLNSFGTTYQLENGFVTLQYQDIETTVSVSPITGRVTVQ